MSSFSPSFLLVGGLLPKDRKTWVHPPFSWTRPRRTERRALTTQPRGGSGIQRVNGVVDDHFGETGAESWASYVPGAHMEAWRPKLLGFLLLFYALGHVFGLVLVLGQIYLV
ncbi:hypothetical protein CXB51_008627 [Gossypium anomalum]|uniref:Uncharacterized protein n=1 Tax=Gossypium anomalum TaxID=47600 RepID=A0A8J5ZB24_9ROSI|nr:hypothetical protein CXB51_008627 [Gossypium anomalum]